MIKPTTKRFLMQLTTLLLPLLLPVITSCTIGKIESRESEEEDNNSPEKISMTFMMPALTSDVLVNSELRGGKVMLFSSSWDNDGHVFMFAKQNGKMINIGRYPISTTNSTNTVFKVELNAPDALDTKAPYQLYALSGAYNVDNNELFYRVNLSRNSGLSMWMKSQKSDGTVLGHVAGVAEVLYVVNKTDKPIKFIHKGYDAAEKWYYAKAQVSVEDGHVQKAEEGSEVVGKAKEIAVFDGESFQQVTSYYVPTGKKIQDAQLIAEIDGKEVRSENRISSDITLQTGHAYGIFAIWDGEKLTLGDDEGSEPVVVDITDPEKSGIKVKSIEKDGTMTIEASEKDAPKVGDILCSGPTKLAPYGYMLRVTEINKKQSTRGLPAETWEFIIKTTVAGLVEVLGNFHYAFPINLEDIKIGQVYDNDGNSLEWTENKPKEWTIKREFKLTDNLSITPEIVIKPKKIVPYIDTKNKAFEKFGADIDMDVDLGLQVDAKISREFDKKIPLFHVILEPIPICETPPIVLTILLQVYLEFKADGTVKLSWKPIDSSWRVKAGAYYNFNSNKVLPNVTSDTGEKTFYTAGLLEDRGRSANMMEGGMSLNGSVSAAVGVSASVGVNGCNLIKRLDFMGNIFDFMADMVAVDLWADFTRKFSATLAVDNINTEVWTDYHFKDDCKLEFYRQYHAKFFLRIWNPFSKAFWGLEPEVKTDPMPFYDDVLYPTLFVPDFKGIKVAIANRNINISAIKYKPYFYNTLFKEELYGFRYGKYTDKHTKIKDWTDVPITKETHLFEDLMIYVQGSISLDDLSAGCTYFVCPYSYEHTPIDTYDYFHKKGLYFRVNNDGTVTFNELPNIPGVDL